MVSEVSPLDDQPATDALPPDHTLALLIRRSKSPEGAGDLLADGTPARAAAWLASCLDAWRRSPHSDAPPHAISQVLTLLRNLCALGAPSAIAIVDSGAVASAGAAAHLAASRPVRPDREGWLLRVCAQFLGNCATASPEGAASVWRRCFPDVFESLATAGEAGIEPLCMALTACCRASRRCCLDLCGESGRGILDAAAGGLEFGGGAREWLAMLVGHIGYCEGLLGEVVGTSGDSSGPSAASPDLKLLRVLALPDLFEWVPRRGLSAQIVLKSLNALSCLTQRLAAECGEAKGGPYAPERLELVLQCLRGGTGFDGLQGMGEEAGGDPVSALCADSGLLECLVGCLRSLEPIQLPGRACPGQGPVPAVGEGQMGSERIGWETIPRMASQTCQDCEESEVGGRRGREEGMGGEGRCGGEGAAGGFPRKQPYRGYRTDVVAVLANSMYRRPEVQRAVMGLGGLPLLLNQCRLDDASPMVNEWALWAVRNMCEGSAEAREFISGLQLQTVVDLPELAERGIKIEVDRDTGKLKVVKRESDSC
ncbi:unnamed protein product [Ostreobium quekettii]|uniref:Ataxin-10 domain-containing protein n=1 Tax=Ostreobium quekettii TaxID=121088 RepID=A0A8S1J3V9_9CHLO|nr:unnamed protein product [Ostreobium quekettii]|eukprot:evm.model.scf_450.7 EVM.evm.TU.scf_450.7   scf_450:71359-72978(+)